jgi:hypothetical protein
MTVIITHNGRDYSDNEWTATVRGSVSNTLRANIGAVQAASYRIVKYKTIIPDYLSDDEIMQKV